MEGQVDLERDNLMTSTAYNVGKPYGKKSFHFIKTSYWDSQLSPVKMFPFLHLKRGSKHSEYKKALLKRYRYLVRYFLFISQDLKESLKFKYEDRLLLLEVKELISEMVSSGIEPKLLIPIFDKEAEECESVRDNIQTNRVHNLYQLFGTIVEEATEQIGIKDRSFRFYYLNRYMILPLFIVVALFALLFLFATFL